MPGYTRGDWKYYRDSMTATTAVCAEDGMGFFSKEVARIRGDNQEETDANAHLIAAAPAMYEALGELMQSVLEEMGLAAGQLDGWFKAKRALAKAEGQEG